MPGHKGEQLHNVQKVKHQTRKHFKSDGGLSSFPSFVLFGRINLSENDSATMSPYFSCEEIPSGRPLAHTGGPRFKVKYISHRGGLPLKPRRWSALSAGCRCSLPPLQAKKQQNRHRNQRCHLTKCGRPGLNATDAMFKFICHSRY